MPTLTIDHRKISVPVGTKVIEAAEQLGIYIPRFCYHPALGPVGACRVCAVMFEDGPVKGLNMSCMVVAEDEMRISTTHARAVEFRKYVIEWLMINHPHDCPVCDEGGHCLLQDMTVAGGHGRRRYPGKKRTYPDQYLGPLVRHEMNRCIQCYRCARFYQEFAGYRDLGTMGIAGRTYFGRASEGVLESPFSGNLIDICPTGVYTDNPSRYTGRRWDFERTPGICIHCSLGCHTTVSARNRAVVRQEARYSEEVNGYFMCDRGRYGFYYANRSDRPVKGMVDGREVSPAEAVEAARKRLSMISETYGNKAIAMVGSERSCLETITAIHHLCRINSWQGPVFHDRRRLESIQTAVARMTPALSISMSDITSADAVLMVGADPVNEAPMLALAVRQARRNNAAVMAMDARPLDWPHEFERLTVAPGDYAAILEHLSRPDANPSSLKSDFIDDANMQSIARWAEILHRSRRPAIICGTDTTGARGVDAAADLAETLGRLKKHAGLFYILPHANSFGARLIDTFPLSTESLLDQIEDGTVKAVVLSESDINVEFYNRPRLAQALDRLELLVAADCVRTPFFQKAGIQIPVQTIFESGGIHVNQEGRAQASAKAHCGGIPIALTGGGGHPPRLFMPDFPGSDVPDICRVLWHLAGHPPVVPDAMREWMADTFPVLAELAAGMDDSGIRIFDPRKPSPDLPGDLPEDMNMPTADQFLLMPVASTFGDDPRASRSDCFKSFEKSELYMSATDAASLGFSDQIRVRLDLDETPLVLTLRITRHIAPGVLVLPRQTAVFWQQFSAPRPFVVDRGRLRIERED